MEMQRGRTMLAVEEFDRTSKIRRKPSLVVSETDRPSLLHFVLQIRLDCSIVNTGAGRETSKTATVDCEVARSREEVVE